MFYLVTQTFIWLLLAFLLGLLIGWLLWRRTEADEMAERSLREQNQNLRAKLASLEGAAGRNDGNASADQQEIESLRLKLAECQSNLSACESQSKAAVASESTVQTEIQGLAAVVDRPADDLKLISGVGPKLEGLLNELGITHFSQVASFTEEQIAEVNSRLSFTGRIEREGWVEQAKILAAGGETEFSSRNKK